VLLTAQHLRASTGVEGVNAFCRLHGPREWTEAQPRDLPEGELVNQVISIRPGGNQVRSYVDVVAPDETATREIQNALVKFIEEARGHSLPWVGSVGRCAFRFGVETRLHPSWPDELRQLLLAALNVRRAA
jgi:hypothetical protein